HWRKRTDHGRDENSARLARAWIACENPPPTHRRRTKRRRALGMELRRNSKAVPRLVLGVRRGRRAPGANRGGPCEWQATCNRSGCPTMFLLILARSHAKIPLRASCFLPDSLPAARSRKRRRTSRALLDL